MRITYRNHGGNREYWQSRWDGVAEGDLGSLDLSRYPGRYAEEALSGKLPVGPILEAGCGAGRVAIHYHRQGRAMVGMDFIPSALIPIRAREPRLPVVAGDILRLPFPDHTFALILAFGLYHNLEHGLDQALSQSFRVLKPGGMLCASMRLDNLQNRVIDLMANKGKTERQTGQFHKLNLTPQELEQAFTRAGFKVESIVFVENMPFLYKFPFFRHASHRVFNERQARAEGYRLSWLGGWLQKGMIFLMPGQFSNVGVIMARVPPGNKG